MTPEPSGKPEPSAEHRAGFICFIGRPNAGKSTLTNALVGQKIAITSSKPQTTRRTIRGIVHRPSAQLIVVDTPGLHRPRTLLGERLNDLVRETLLDVDVIAMCIPADQKVGPGDKFIAAELEELRRGGRKKPFIAVVTKSDLVTRQALAEQLIAVDQLAPWAAVIPVSAVSDFQVETLIEVLAEHLPKSPPLYPEDATHDEERDITIAELVREAALEGVHDELPHSINVVVEDIEPREDNPNLLDVRVSIFVERDSQKGIIIGRGGSRLKEIGTAARREIEQVLEQRIHLDLRVKVAKEWQRDPRALNRFGF